MPISMSQPTREQAWALIQESTQGESLRRHMLSVEAAMRAYARHFGEDEERWGLLGLIHDWDYESGPDPDQHPARGIELLRLKGWPQDLLDDIASHADGMHVPRDTRIRQALYAVDQMCGFVIACALVKGRSLGAIDAGTVRKKMKDKTFARGVDRQHLMDGVDKLGVPFETHVDLVRSALQQVAAELGLEP
jgi:predicted hydrolase (HD superfamily)